METTKKPPYIFRVSVAKLISLPEIIGNGLNRTLLGSASAELSGSLINKNQNLQLKNPHFFSIVCMEN